MTPLQLKALDFIRGEILTKGYAPTMTEIGAHLGIKGKNTIWSIVDRLVVEGKLVRKPAVSRGLSLPRVPSLLSVPLEHLHAEIERRRALGEARTAA